MSELDATAFHEAERRIRRVDELVEGMAEVAIDDMAAVALANVRRRRGRHRVTGKGERLVRLQSTGSGDGRRARIHAGGRVAHLIAGGTRAHVIRPVAARALAIGGVGRGFAAAVRHPGTRADPFVAKGIEDSRGAVAAITDTAGDELAVDVAHKIGRR
jgi:hypothetical protein